MVAKVAINGFGRIGRLVLRGILELGRKTSAMSSGVPNRRSGRQSTISLSASRVGARRAMPSVPAIAPGMIEFTRMPSGPHSMARVRVSISTPAFAARTWKSTYSSGDRTPAAKLLSLTKTFPLRWLGRGSRRRPRRYPQPRLTE